MKMLECHGVWTWRGWRRGRKSPSPRDGLPCGRVPGQVLHPPPLPSLRRAAPGHLAPLGGAHRVSSLVQPCLEGRGEVVSVRKPETSAAQPGRLASPGSAERALQDAACAVTSLCRHSPPLRCPELGHGGQTSSPKELTSCGELGSGGAVRMHSWGGSARAEDPLDVGMQGLVDSILERAQALKGRPRADLCRVQGRTEGRHRQTDRGFSQWSCTALELRCSKLWCWGRLLRVPCLQGDPASPS